MVGHLKERGYDVAEAAGVSEALPLAERLVPDAILTEEELPAFDALTARLREHSTLRAVPVVIINPEAEEHSPYDGAVQLIGYEHLEQFLTTRSSTVKRD